MKRESGRIEQGIPPSHKSRPGTPMTCGKLLGKILLCSYGGSLNEEGFSGEGEQPSPERRESRGGAAAPFGGGAQEHSEKIEIPPGGRSPPPSTGGAQEHSEKIEIPPGGRSPPPSTFDIPIQKIPPFKMSQKTEIPVIIFLSTEPKPARKCPKFRKNYRLLLTCNLLFISLPPLLWYTCNNRMGELRPFARGKSPARMYG